MTTSHYRTLDESKIIDTLTALRDRIDNQFPDSGLGRVADEMIAVGSEVADCADYLNAPELADTYFRGIVDCRNDRGAVSGHSSARPPHRGT